MPPFRFKRWQLTAALPRTATARIAVAGRTPRRCAGIEDALTRMQQESTRLSDEQARHLAIHGASRNEDAT